MRKMELGAKNTEKDRLCEKQTESNVLVSVCVKTGLRVIAHNSKK